MPLVNFVEADPAAMATLAQQAWLCPQPQVQSSELAEALSGLLSLAKPAPPAQPASSIRVGVADGKLLRACEPFGLFGNTRVEAVAMN